MTDRAIVVFPTAVTAEQLLLPIAGVPSLLRLLLCAQRAGIGEIVLLGAQRCPVEVQQLLTHDPRLMSRLIWLEDHAWPMLLRTYPDLEKQWWAGALWVLPAGGVIDVRLLREAVQWETSRAVAVIDTGPGTWSGGEAAFFKVAGEHLRGLVEASAQTTLSVLLARVPQHGDSATIPNHGLVCAPVVGQANRLAVERGLLQSIAGGSDGWVDRHLNRRLSPWITRWLLRTPLTPNHVTLIAFMIGLLSAVYFAYGSWLSGIVGALLFQWSAVIDCCDGEIARLKFLESTSGYYLDIVCDNIVHIAVFAGIAWGSSQTLGQGYPLLLGGLAAFGTVMAFLVVLTMRHGRPRIASATVDRCIDALTNRDFSLLLVVCAVSATLPWFLWALAVGVNVFWPLALGLAWRAKRTPDG
jgi:phosphatidylglycerophosphate synthase